MNCAWLLQNHPSYCITVKNLQLEISLGNIDSGRFLIVFNYHNISNRAALSNSEVTSCLLDQLQLVDVNKNPTQGLKVVCLSSVIPCFETLTFLCKIMVSSCISSLTTVAEQTAVTMLNGL